MNTVAFILSIPSRTEVPSVVKLKHSERVLVNGLRNGERKALSTLYDMYSDSLYGIILRIIKKEEQAEDVLQDTFVKIWKSFSQYDPSKGRLFTWMANMARNLAIDQMRSKYHRNNADNQCIDNVSYLVDSRHNVSYNTDRIGIREISSVLKPEQKLVLDLIYFSGYTHVEAAQELNIPVGTVKTRLRIAIQNLKKLFN